MNGDWSWAFESGAFVLRDPTGTPRASIWPRRDGRWSWRANGTNGTATTLKAAVLEVLALLGLKPDIAAFLADLADEAIERAGEELGDA